MKFYFMVIEINIKTRTVPMGLIPPARLISNGTNMTLIIEAKLCN